MKGCTITLSVQQSVRGLPLPPDLKNVGVVGATLAYRECGSGDPVVFVHGSISDLTIWNPQLPAIGARYRVIASSRRYAWPNADLAMGERDTMDRHVDDLLAFLRAAGAYPAHLIGNSLGAFIVLVAAIRDSQAARSLVLEEPPLVPLVAGNPPSPPTILRSLLRRPGATLAGLRFAATTVQPTGKLIQAGQIEASIDRFARGVLGGQAAARLPGYVRQHMLANASTHVGQYLADGGFADITEAQIRAVTAPALVVTGASSPAFFRRVAAVLASLLPHSDTFVVPSASHAMHVENPDALNAALLNFLARR